MGTPPLGQKDSKASKLEVCLLVFPEQREEQLRGGTGWERLELCSHRHSPQSPRPCREQHRREGPPQDQTASSGSTSETSRAALPFMVWESEQCPGRGAGRAGRAEHRQGKQGNQTGTQHRSQVPSSGMGTAGMLGTAGMPSLRLCLVLTPMETAAL